MWPHLEIAKENRGREVKQQRRVPSPTEGEAGPSNVNREPVNIEETAIIKHLSTRVIATTPSTIATSVTAPEPAATPARNGKTHSVFLQDLRPFQRIAADESATRTALKMQSLELRSIGIRESAEAKALRFHIEGRAKVIQQLATLLSDAGTDEEGDSEQEESESSDGEGDSQQSG